MLLCYTVRAEAGAILEGQDKNDGKLNSSLLYYYFCDHSLLLGFLSLF